LNYKLISSIALSLLLARWKQTLVAAVGVMFSITMFIALLGFMNGLNDLLDGLILNRTAHVRLYSEVKVNPNQPINRANGFTSGHNFVRSIKPANSRQEIYNSQAILHAIRQDERVLGVAPKVSAPLFFNTGTIDITGVVNGIDAEAESRLFHFADYVTKGRPEDIASIPNSIILGKALADKLMAGIGDLIYVTTPGGERFPLKVVGYFQSGIQEFDKTQSYASLSTTQKLFGRGKSYITDIQVKLNDLEWAPAVAKEYQRLFQVDAEDIQTANSQFETGSFVRSLISYAVGITL
jgi:lipoprotein-releasing system permease protein